MQGHAEQGDAGVCRRAGNAGNPADADGRTTGSGHTGHGRSTLKKTLIMGMRKADAQQVAEQLKPCPFCGCGLEINLRGSGEFAPNPTAKCVTADCMGGRLPTICLDVLSQVAGWNTRPDAVPVKTGAAWARASIGKEAGRAEN